MVLAGDKAESKSGSPPIAKWPGAEERVSRRCRRMIEQLERSYSFDGGADADVDDASQALAALESAILAAPALSMGALRFKLQLIRRTPSAWRTPEETDDLLALLACDLETLRP
jgi:hypothetical protein